MVFYSLNNFHKSFETLRDNQSVGYAKSISKRRSVLVFVICGFIKNFLPKSYFILQIYHVKSFEMRHVTPLYFNFSVLDIHKTALKN